MRTTHSKLMAAAALAAALLAGCGGSNDDHAGGGGPGEPPGPVAQTISDVVAYINSLIAGTADSAEPLDTNGLTLTADNAAEPASLQ